jgi:hypothetical protein
MWWSHAPTFNEWHQEKKKEKKEEEEKKKKKKALNMLTRGAM